MRTTLYLQKPDTFAKIFRILLLSLDFKTYSTQIAIQIHLSSIQTCRTTKAKASRTQQTQSYPKRCKKRSVQLLFALQIEDL